MAFHHVRLTKLAAGLSFGAAAIHIGVTGDHFAEWWGYGAFFLIASALQFLYGFLLLANGPPGTPVPMAYTIEAWMNFRRSLFRVGVAGNSAIIALYLVTRTVGIPLLGPEAGEVEDVGPIDALSKVIELALVACLLRLLRVDSPGEPEASVRYGRESP